MHKSVDREQTMWFKLFTKYFSVTLKSYRFTVIFIFLLHLAVRALWIETEVVQISVTQVSTFKF